MESLRGSICCRICETTAQLLGLERRQVFRLLKAYRSEGATGLISRRRGRPSNRRKPEEVRDEALAIIRKRYWDFGPTLAAEKLREVHFRRRRAAAPWSGEPAACHGMTAKLPLSLCGT